MALADFDAFRAMLASPGWTDFIVKSYTFSSPQATGEILFAQTAMGTTGRPDSMAVPSTAVALNSSSVGAFPHPASSGRLCITSAGTGLLNFNTGGETASGGAYLLIDKLSIQGGLSGTSTTAQTTNLPTAALTRYTGGEGVLIGIQIYASLGNTDSVVTISYTNSAGTAGRTATQVFTAFPLAHCVYFPGLEAGDLGVRSVESVTLSASTGTAGDFGVFLFKPVAIIPPNNGQVSANEIVGWNTGIDPAAFIEPLVPVAAFSPNLDATVFLSMTDVQ